MKQKTVSPGVEPALSAGASNSLTTAPQLHTWFERIKKQFFSVIDAVWSCMVKLYLSWIQIYIWIYISPGQKPFPLGRHIPIWLIYGSNPPPPTPRCALFGCNYELLFPEEYTVRFSFCPKSDTERVLPGHPIIFLKSNKFNMAAVSVKRSIVDCGKSWTIKIMFGKLFTTDVKARTM